MYGLELTSAPELRTDYTLLQRDIEKGVFTVFARPEGDEPPEPPSFASEREITFPLPGVELSSLAQAPATPQPEEAPLTPFAKIGSVMAGSPAAKGGVCAGDLLLQFGYVTAANHKQLTALRDVVIANLDHDVGVRVLRGRKRVEVSVRPGKWAGKGVLGYGSPAPRPPRALKLTQRTGGRAKLLEDMGVRTS